MSYLKIEELIECVRRYPILYNTKNPDYKNYESKNRVWRAIAAELNEKDSKYSTGTSKRVFYFVSA